ncbi:MAG: avidin/streptavidin family protein [Maricaulaceae bacterium]
MRRILSSIAISTMLSLGLSACAQALDKPLESIVENAPASLFDGTWENDRGSAAVLETLPDGRLTGHYQTNVGQPDKGQKFPLTGFAEGDQLTFTVNFKGYGSITAWAGQHSVDAKGEFIKTLWHLTRDVDDAAETDDMWGSITAGASTFRRLKVD